MHRPPPSHALLDAALGAQSRGELDRADALYRDHVRRHRDDPVGLAAYGEFCLQRGQAMAACWLLDRAARLRPGDAGVLTRLGYAHLRGRNHAAALAAFAAALEASPQDPLALNGKGLCHLLADAPLPAVEAFARATAADPRDASILVNGAEARHKNGDLAGAAVWIERAARIAPRATILAHARYLREAGQSERAWTLLGLLAAAERGCPQAILEAVRCLRSLDRFPEAIALLDAFERQTPGTPEYREEMGHCLPSPQDAPLRHAHWIAACGMLIDARKLRRARLLLERLLAEDARQAPAWTLRGRLHLALAKDDEAETSFRQAIACDPILREPQWRLASLLEERNRIAEARAVVDSLRQLPPDDSAGSGEADIQSRLVSCRLARREKRPDAALQEAAELDALPLSDEQRLLTTFERAKALDLLDRPDAAIAAFESGNAQLRRIRAQSHQGSNPFLAEVEALLALVRKGWLDRWPAVEIAPPAPGAEADPVFLVGFPRSGTTLLEQVLGANSQVQVLAEQATAVIMRDIVKCMPDGYPGSVPRLDAIDLAYLRRAYFDAVAACCTRDPSLLLIDKQPLQVTRAALLQRVFPRARYVFAARHPCDATLSCFMQNFAPNDAMSNFFTLDDTVKLYVRTMELWQAFRDRLGLSVHTVRYERLVDDFDGETGRLCDYLGIPWQEQQARFSDRANGGKRITTPSYEQVGQPIYQRAVGRWERYRRHLEPYLPALQPWIDRYG